MHLLLLWFLLRIRPPTWQPMRRPPPVCQLPSNVLCHP